MSQAEEPATSARQPWLPASVQDHFLDLLDGYKLVNEGNRDYLLTHLQRYHATLDLVRDEGLEQPRILELGGGGLAFTLLLRDTFPGAEIVIGEYTGAPGSREISALHRSGNERLAFAAHYFNLDSDPFPFPDASFDVVLCMEILEHLLLDPYHLFLEARRVLRPGGVFLVTTPNIVSAEALQKVLDLHSPYLFGIYSRHGAYGRHNREYTPGEVNGLGECAGLDTAALVTSDVYPPSREVTELRSWLAERDDPLHLRGQNIFYLGRRGERQPTGYPEFLFDFDPSRHRARLQVSLLRVEVVAAAPVQVQAQVTNHGTYTWQVAGEGYTRFRAMLYSAEGALLQRDFFAHTLPQAVPPGGNLQLDLSFPAPAQAGSYRLRFDMVHEQVCWFSDMRSDYAQLELRVSADG